MRCASAAVLLGLLATALASPVSRRSPYMLKEKHYAPYKWTNVGDAPANHMIELRLMLKNSRFDELEKAVHEVSDPDHERYGQHLTAAEVDELVKPTDETLAMVHEWLAENGLSSETFRYAPAKDWITFRLPVKDVESLLDTKYSVFEHEDGDRIVRTEEWSLPEHLHGLIDAIQPTNSFFRPFKRSSMAMPVAMSSDRETVPLQTNSEAQMAEPQSIQSACNFSAVTSKCLRTLYGTINYKPQAMGSNAVGINNFLNETSNRSDVNLFLKQFRRDAAGYAFQYPINVVAGGQNQQTPNTPAQNAAGLDIEGNLDAETVLGITYPTPLMEYNTGGMPPFTPDDASPTDTNEPYMTWLSYILRLTTIPQTISNSYGDDEQTVPESYAQTVCNQFARLGARGITVLFASGDNGVGPNGSCFSNDGKNRNVFIPSFPPSCPYVTAVGGTMKYPEVAAYDPRNGFASGGGFSNYFGRPGFQNSAVEAYLNEIGNLYAGKFSPSGRAYPDIAAQSVSFIVTWGGQNILVDGTSASTPTASSVIALVNDALIADGKPPLGYLNPLLYKSLHSAFTDVTSGSAVGCNRAGFPATSGWDAVTGFGTPNFKAITSALNVLIPAPSS